MGPDGSLKCSQKNAI